ncbi:MAG: hypothetical protein ACFFDN_31480 [Candidatus Hodarchaeota archaeon]
MKNSGNFILGLLIVIISIIFMAIPKGLLDISSVSMIIYNLFLFLGIFAAIILYYGVYQINKKNVIIGFIMSIGVWVYQIIYTIVLMTNCQFSVALLHFTLFLIILLGTTTSQLLAGIFYEVLVTPMNITLANGPIFILLSVFCLILAFISYMIAVRGKEFKMQKEERIAKSEEEYQKLKEDAVIYIKKISSIYDNVSFSFISSKTELKKDEILRIIIDLLHKEEISGSIKGNSIVFKEEEKKVKKSKFPINCPQCHYFFNKFHVPTQVLEGKFDYRQPVYCPKCKEEFTLFISKNPDTGRLDIQYT